MSQPPMQNESGIDARVLEFYRELPFNYYSSANVDVDRIQKMNSIKSHYVLEPLLNSSTHVLDVGCGPGRLSNAIAYYYKSKVTGIDFNPVAIQRATEVANLLKQDIRFEVADIFEYESANPFDLVCSVGVLHHTKDCHAALRRIFKNLIKDGGYFYGGLYHLHGRSPFLKHFDDLKQKGLSEDELFENFSELHSNLTDKKHLLSWFRDQVIHPHETQHTLKELCPLFEEANLQLISTSINHFGPTDNPAQLFDMEPGMKSIGDQKLQDKQYYPGFFTFLCQKKSGV
jgi:2-polyprenyl-3-methyl-5-hydroxy-6-metoxy-1,4-benzoquinol methylase